MRPQLSPKDNQTRMHIKKLLVSLRDPNLPEVRKKAHLNKLKDYRSKGWTIDKGYYVTPPGTAKVKIPPRAVPPSNPKKSPNPSGNKPFKPKSSKPKPTYSPKPNSGGGGGSYRSKPKRSIPLGKALAITGGVALSGYLAKKLLDKYNSSDKSASQSRAEAMIDKYN